MEHIYIPKHGRKISYTDFIKVTNELEKLKEISGETRIDYPDFVRPYVINLVRMYLKVNPQVQLAQVSAKENVHKFLKQFRAHKSKHSKDKLGYTSSFPYSEEYSNIYEEFGSYLEENNIKVSNEIISTIGEVGENAIEHAYSDGNNAYFGIGAQYFPNIPKLEVTISDTGKGISKNVYDFLSEQKSLPSFEELERRLMATALSGKFTSRPSGHGGRGLSGLKRHAIKNKMDLIIATNSQYYTVSNKSLQSGSLPIELPGTLINITFYL